jgi:glycine betaine transporter
MWPDLTTFRPTKKQASLILAVICCLILFRFPVQTITILSGFSRATIEGYDWFFLRLSSIILVITVVLACLPLGKWRLGGSEAKPHFSWFSWVAMLFTAGMGSGLIFWSVAEPIYHLNAPGNPQHHQATALAITYFHWGLHAWGIYALSALAIAWFSYNRGQSLRISSSFYRYPRLQPYLAILDFMAILAILFGVAATVSNTAALIEAGLIQLQWLTSSHFIQRLVIILLISVCFVSSSLLGLNKGIRRLSLFNLYFAVLFLMLAVFLALSLTPLQSLLDLLGLSTQIYIQSLPAWSWFVPEAYKTWVDDWTIIYLIWWIAWAPFVGLFIAKISYGRTIRQCLLGVVLIPTASTILWFNVFATAAFHLPNQAEVISLVQANYTQGLFFFFGQFSLGVYLSLLAMLLLTTFVITSADSAVYVMQLLSLSSPTEKNSAIQNNEDTPETIKLSFAWGMVLTLLTLALSYQDNIKLTTVIATVGAIPFTFIFIAQIFHLLADMWAYPRGNVRS